MKTGAKKNLEHAEQLRILFLQAFVEVMDETGFQPSVCRKFLVLASQSPEALLQLIAGYWEGWERSQMAGSISSKQ